MKNRSIVLLATLSLTPLVAAEPLALTVHTDQATKNVSTGIYGQFLEHIFNSVHGGLWGDQILNGDLTPKTATMQLVVPGGETVKNSLEPAQ
jgi:hypothetical protein